LSIGTYLGRIRLATGALAQDVLVTLHVSTAPASMSILSGNNATASVGATLPPLAVSLVDANGTPVPGVPVNFAVASGGGSLNSRTATSDSTGKASAVLTLPASPGSVQVVARAVNLSVTFTATAIVIIPPALMANSVVNGVTFSSAAPPSP